MAMDQKSKSIDCYFYYYSECVRGNFCKFRHEPAALGCEDMCLKWKDGSCTEPHCGLRHMELKKNRKEIPCYWEKQPGGCRKAHCAFKHQQKGSQAQGESLSMPENTKKDSEAPSWDWKNAKVDGASSLEVAAEPPVAEASRRLSQGGPESYTSSPAAVEPIVVNFEEESDSESAPSWTPTKVLKEKDSLHVKTLEEIRLEKIQAESAAYWEGIAGGPMAWEAANPAANPSASPCTTNLGPRKHCNSSSVGFKKSNLHIKNVTKEVDFRVLSLDEIRKNRSRKVDTSNGLCNDKLNHNLPSKLLLNGHTNEQSRDLKSHIQITDLRTKLSKGKSDGPQVLNSSDTLSSKRRKDSSPQSGPVKKACIRLRRLSELTGDEKVSKVNIYEERLCEEEDIDGNIIGDIDKLLME